MRIISDAAVNTYLSLAFLQISFITTKFGFPKLFIEKFL
jgi:hypothetical protein